MIKSAEYKDGDFTFTLFTQEEKFYLDVGGNEDGSKGFISSNTYAFNEETNEYTYIDGSGLQNGYDYRGDTTSVWSHWLGEWNGTDPLRFDLKYIDSKGEEFLDHYYYDSANGLSNRPADKKLAGEADLVFYEDEDDLGDGSGSGSYYEDEDDLENGSGSGSYYEDEDDLGDGSGSGSYYEDEDDLGDGSGSGSYYEDEDASRRGSG